MAKVPSIRAFCILTTIMEIWEQFESSLGDLNKISEQRLTSGNTRHDRQMSPANPTGQTPPKMVWVAGAEPLFQFGGLQNKHSVFKKYARWKLENIGSYVTTVTYVNGKCYKS